MIAHQGQKCTTAHQTFHIAHGLPPAKINGSHSARTPTGPTHAFVLEALQVRTTSFIEALKAAKPTLEAEQRAGRALLWDRALDRDALAEWRDARVPQQPYVYQSKPTPEHLGPPQLADELAADIAPPQPDVVDQVAVARLYGEPLFRMPLDLYIPPDALEVFLEAFEGPLDLLLYLIRKQNFNILDIPLASVTRQYLEYVDQIRKHNLELASEYLLMAAMLIEIKSPHAAAAQEERGWRRGRGPARRTRAPPGRIRADQAWPCSRTPSSTASNTGTPPTLAEMEAPAVQPPASSSAARRSPNRPAGWPRAATSTRRWPRASAGSGVEAVHRDQGRARQRGQAGAAGQARQDRAGHRPPPQGQAGA
jgi:hypothetical protein